MQHQTTTNSSADLLSSESGFTIIEVLVSSAIVVILAGLALQAYVIYREDSYHTIAKQMMGNTRTALEAGKVDSEAFAGVLQFVSTTPGEATEMDGETLVPGLVLPGDFSVQVIHNPDCNNPACVEDYVVTRHCKAGQRVVYTRTHQLGASTVFNSAAAGAC